MLNPVFLQSIPDITDVVWAALERSAAVLGSSHQLNKFHDGCLLWDGPDGNDTTGFNWGKAILSLFSVLREYGWGFETEA